jgi:hypothetical protein
MICGAGKKIIAGSLLFWSITCFTTLIFYPNL